MSDANGSTGEFEDLGTAHQTGNWEARLELARKQRAIALAKANRSVEALPETNGAQKDPVTAAMDAPLNVEFKHTTTQFYPKKHATNHRKQGKPNIGIVASAALLCGVFLGLASSQIAGGWPQDPATSVLNEVSVAKVAPGNVSKQTTLGAAPSGLEFGFEAFRKRPGSFEDLSPPSKVTRSDPPGPLAAPIFAPGGVAANESVRPIPVSLPFSDVKPLPVSELSPAIEVSLFVPTELSAETSDRALDLLTGGRTAVVATARVGFSVRETQVRYYHPGDAEEAMLAAGALGGISRDFTKSATKTRPGRIEVYLAGNGVGSGQKRNRQSQSNQFDQFITRLLDELR